MPTPINPEKVNKCVEVHFTGVPAAMFEDFWTWVKRWTANAAEQAGPEGSAVATEINLYLCDHAYASEKEPVHV